MNNKKYNLANSQSFPKKVVAGIYAIKNLVNNKVYIGQSVNIFKRIKEHINSTNYADRCFEIHDALKKYGLKNFEVQILEEFNPKTPNIDEVLNTHEFLHILTYDSFGENGYNMTLGGDAYRIYDYDNFDDLVNDYQNGLTIYELSIKYKISEPTISKILKANGIDPIKDLTDFDKAVSNLYKSGYSIATVAASLYCSTGRVQRSLIRSKTPMREVP